MKLELLLMSEDYDVGIHEEDLLSLDDENIAWFKENLGLSQDDLLDLCVSATKIEQELKPNDELLQLTYDTDNGNWYIHFHRSQDDKVRWNISIYKKDRDYIRRKIN